jgi:hypothetical protein
MTKNTFQLYYTMHMHAKVKMWQHLYIGQSQQLAALLLETALKIAMYIPLCLFKLAEISNMLQVRSRK